MSKVSKVLMMGGRNGRSGDNYDSRRGQNDYNRDRGQDRQREDREPRYPRDDDYTRRDDGYRRMRGREYGESRGQEERIDHNRGMSYGTASEDEDYYFKVKGRFGPKPMAERYRERRPEIMDERTAEEWTEHMKNEDGTVGPHWPMDAVKKVMEQHKELQSFELPEVYAVINMMYSDYCEVAKKLNVNNMDFYVCMTKAWLSDKDAATDKGKTAAYYNYVVK